MKVLICLIPFDYSSKTGMNIRILLILRGLVRLKKRIFVYYFNYTG